MGVSRAASPTNLFNPIGRPTNGVHFKGPEPRHLTNVLWRPFARQFKSHGLQRKSVGNCHILENTGESYRLQDAKRRRRRTS